jgi:hypothetical protein
MRILNGVPVKTRVPGVVWLLAVLMILFSLMPSLTDESGKVYHASMVRFLSILPGPKDA